MTFCMTKKSGNYPKWGEKLLCDQVKLIIFKPKLSLAGLNKSGEKVNFIAKCLFCFHDLYDVAFMCFFLLKEIY